VNFGLLYGQQAEGFMRYAKNSYGVDNMSLEDAERYREAFFNRYPELEAWHEKVDAQCRIGKQYSRTPLGRQRKLPRYRSYDYNGPGRVVSTAAKNAPIQGAGGDAIRITLARLFEDRYRCPGAPTLRAAVHDEVILSVAQEYAEDAAAWVQHHMAEAEREAIGDPDSPITIDVEIRDSWGS
jgi:DNA polymerase I-like protein with 3'-5' exonuclease and polymerase domains